MLAVPASAYALTTGAASDTQAAAITRIQARISPRRTSFGRTVTVTGTAPTSDVGNLAILETSPGPKAGWHYLAGARIAAGGAFELRSALQRSSFVRVVDAADSAGAASIAPNWAASPAGTSASAPAPVTVVAQLTVRRRSINVLGGNRITVHGRLLPAVAGRVIRLQGHGAGGWSALATGHTGGSGRFTLHYLASSGLQRRLRVLFAGDGVNARSVAPVGRLTVYGESVASWYNDAGNTACGFKVSYGVANRTLPCGTKVHFRYGGRSVTATVDDRGPFVAGRDWDLNQNTAAALGFTGVGTVWVTQ